MATLALAREGPNPVVEAKSEPARLEQAVDFQVRSARRADFGTHAVVYRRVAPRELPPLPKAEPQPLTPEQAEDLQRKAEKKSELLFLSCTVYDRRVTEMRWEHEGRRYRAFSNLDGNLMRGLMEFETADRVYTLMLGIGEETEASGRVVKAAAAATLRGAPTLLPPTEEFSPTRAEYFLAEDQPAPAPAALVAIDALHTFFDTHKADLIQRHAEREARRIAAEKWRAENPPVKEDMILNFWTLEEDASLRNAPTR